MKIIPQWQLDKILTALYEPLPPKPPKLVIEAEVPRDVGGINVLYRFDESLEALKAIGYERHLRPVEAFSLLERNLEGKLSEEEQEIAEDMMIDPYYWGEWLSLAWERKGNVLVAYLDPVGLVWDQKKWSYVKQDFSCSEKKQFDITGKAYCRNIDLQKFSDDFVEWHYGRKFSELTKEMREGERSAQVYLPAAGVIWPVGRCINLYSSSRSSSSSISIHFEGASRGVKHL